MAAPARAVITGVGVVAAGVTGDSAALGAYLAAPAPAPGVGAGTARLSSEALIGLMDPGEGRRLSRVCQLTIAAARLALREAGLEGAPGLALVVGTELGDLSSTRAFADGFLSRGPVGLSPLLFPNTVMNAMAATAAIALPVRQMALTLNVPTVAGEQAVARAAAAVLSGRASAVLAGGVDELDPGVGTLQAEIGLTADIRGEGAAFVVIESAARARARGARILGEIAGAACRALPARPWGVGRGGRSRAVGDALVQAGLAPGQLGWCYASASGDTARDRWEHAVLHEALGDDIRVGSLARLLGHHAGLGVVRVAAAAWTARSGLLPASVEPATVLAGVSAGPGLVHGLARGGTQVALVVGAA